MIVGWPLDGGQVHNNDHIFLSGTPLSSPDIVRPLLYNEKPFSVVLRKDQKEKINNRTTCLCSRTFLSDK